MKKLIVLMATATILTIFQSSASAQSDPYRQNYSPYSYQHEGRHKYGFEISGDELRYRLQREQLELENMKLRKREAQRDLEHFYDAIGQPLPRGVREINPYDPTGIRDRW